MKGWILDLYPGRPGEMVVWLKLENGGTRRLVDRWSPSIFVASDSRADLARLAESDDVRNYGAFARFVHKRERLTDPGTSEVLEVCMLDAARMMELARRIERASSFGGLRIYNCDVPPAQSYLYELDLFPTALCEVEESRDGLSWKLLDSTSAYDYDLPPLSTLKVDLSVKKSGVIATPGDPIESIMLDDEVVDAVSEEEMILGLVERVRETDPDILLTRDGDTFLFPYLIARAAEGGVADMLVLGRDVDVLRPPDRAGTSYFSYGKILFKPSSFRLYGRIHLDASSSFSYSGSGLDGLVELSRVCRQPLHTSSRASIGKALSSLQFYHATKKDILIPWKPVLAERFKSRAEMLAADRGGFIFEPQAGVYDDVAELDFSSLYPNIMLKKNISAETVKCPCCPESSRRVPELGWNVCESQGITAKTMEVIVGKRLEYKKRKENAEGEDRKRYDGRQGVLKWLGVTSFGYLGFNNAKFGRIDAHIAVCAWDRKVLVDAMRVAERRGFRVIHGIVDSLWLKKEGADEGDYRELKREIESETGFDMSYEGTYKWIAFLNSKVNPGLPVQNRYFGAYRGGKVKARGIEARRHDTPHAFIRCQEDMLVLMKEAGSVEGVRAILPDCIGVFARYAAMVSRRELPVEEMVFSRNISKDPRGYANNTLEAGVVRLLLKEGVALHQRQGISYVITDYYSRSKRAMPAEALDGRRCYDTKRYTELLGEACSTILEPFDPGMTAEKLLRILTTASHRGL
jgi:DNA polymerase elongation subunit (family B)